MALHRGLEAMAKLGGSRKKTARFVVVTWADGGGVPTKLGLIGVWLDLAVEDCVEVGE